MPGSRNHLLCKMITYTKLAVKGAATILVISLIAAFLGYVVRVILARSLTMEEFGLFYAVFGFLSLIGLFKSFGFDKALAKFIPEFLSKKDNDNIKSSIMYVIIIQLITNIIIIILVYIFSDFLAVSYFKSESVSDILKLMAIAFFIDSFVQVLKTAFQGFKEMVYFAGIDLIRMLLIIAVILLGLNIGYGILSPVYAYIIVPILLLIIFGFILTRKTFPDFLKSRFFVSKKLLKNISHYSIFILATSVAGVVLGYTDIVMLTYFSGLTAVALYSVALPTSRILIYFPRAIVGVLLPVTSELWAKKKFAMLREGMESLYKYSIIIIIPLVFMVFSYSDLIINVFFGSDYIDASLAMKILSIGMIFATLTGISVNFFAGITTTISHFISMVMGLIKTRKFITLKMPVAIWAKTLFSGILFIIIIWLLKEIISMNALAEAAIVLVISGAAYIGFLFLFGIVNMSEAKDLLRRIAK
ncbi:flippase [Candidatus Woesearchaeota archaeon]|nr:flippase [Candidatus Woesearchaeota archaeon]